MNTFLGWRGMFPCTSQHWKVSKFRLSMVNNLHWSFSTQTILSASIVFWESWTRSISFWQAFIFTSADEQVIIRLNVRVSLLERLLPFRRRQLAPKHFGHLTRARFFFSLSFIFSIGAKCRKIRNCESKWRWLSQQHAVLISFL